MYLTIGCLTIVWTGVWYIYLLNHPPGTPLLYYWVAGFTLTGITLVMIGLAVGQIGRAARHAQASDVIVPDVPTVTQQAPPVAVVPTQVPPVSPVPVSTNGPPFPTAVPSRSPAINVPR